MAHVANGEYWMSSTRHHGRQARGVVGINPLPLRTLLRSFDATAGQWQAKAGGISMTGKGGETDDLPRGVPWV